MICFLECTQNLCLTDNLDCSACGSTDKFWRTWGEGFITITMWFNHTSARWVYITMWFNHKAARWVYITMSGQYTSPCDSIIEQPGEYTSPCNSIIEQPGEYTSPCDSIIEQPGEYTSPCDSCDSIIQQSGQYTSPCDSTIISVCVKSLVWSYSLCQKKPHLIPNYFVAPLEEAGQKFTYMPSGCLSPSPRGDTKNSESNLCFFWQRLHMAL